MPWRIGTFILIIVISSCNSNVDKPLYQNSGNDSVLLPDNGRKKGKELDEAKIIAKQIFDNVERCEEGKISHAELDKIAKPLQRRLDSIRLMLTTLEIEELDDYRSQIVSEMVDKKVNRDKK